jgi:hypothetical protein
MISKNYSLTFIRVWTYSLWGALIFLIAAINVSCGQTGSVPVTASPGTKAPTPSGTRAPPSDTNNPAYTVEQLNNLCNAKMDQYLFARQLDEWGVTLDVTNILYLSKSGVDETNLLRIEAALDSLSHSVSPPPSIPPQANNTNVSETNLDIRVVQIAAMFKTDFPITNIAEHFSQCGLKLDAATYHDLDTAGVALTNEEALEQIIASQTAAAATQATESNTQYANLRMAGVTNLNLAAVTNLSVAATNVPMARTNLPVLAEYAQRMATNLMLMEAGGDTNAFSTVTNDLADIAAGINGYAGNLKTSPTNSNWLVAFSAGAEFLNPYNISVPAGTTNNEQKGTLKNSGNSTVGYLQFDIQRRWAFAPSSLSPNASYNRFPLYGGIAALFSTNKSNFYLDSLTPDFQFTFGFLLGNSANATNGASTYSAQTLAGSDIYGTLGAGLPLWRNDWQEDDGFSAQLSLWGSLGVTTESSFEKIHAHEFIGGALEIGLPEGLFGNTNVLTPGLVEAKIGVGHLDFPDTTGKNNLVNLDGNGSPIFNEKFVPEAGVNMFIPFGSVLYLNVEANAFISDQPPNQWNVKVGATIPWTSVKQMFPFVK